jgi:predicted transcriptional regulator of viral defense system
MKKQRIKGISAREMGLISDLEFQQRYYFTRDDIQEHFKNRKELTNTLHNLKTKGRIASLNRNKYYLVPIKARSGSWAEHPFVLADEIFNSERYFIGGWAAANYWGFTDQIPMRIEAYTTKRQGKAELIGTRFIFRRTTEERILTKSLVRKIGIHSFRILKKKESKRWMHSRE